MHRKLKFLAGACVFAAASANGVAAPLPAASAPVVSITARDQPVADFVRDLFGRIGRPVVLSSGLTGTVNGQFAGSVDKVFSDISKAFGLVGYYDGASVYVYNANELTAQNFAIGKAAATRAARSAAAQRLGDSRNVVRVTGDSLVASGTPRFIEQVSAVVQGGGAAVAGAGRLPLDLGGLDPVTPLEFRVFYLKYARAQDTSVTAGGQTTTVPGLATILQNLVLDERPGGSANSNSAPNPTFGVRPVRQSQMRLRGLGLGSVAPSAAQASYLDRLPVLGAEGDAGARIGLGLGGGGGGGMDMGGGGMSAAPLSSDIVRIEANPYLNAIIVRDVPERMAAYDSLIRALDVEPQLVEIEATVIDINIDRLRRLGINWRFGSGGFGFLFGNGSDSDVRLNRYTGSSRRVGTEAITPNAQGGTISTIIGNNREFIARVTALEDKGAARVVSRPQVMTLSNVEAVFDRTRTFYVRVAGRQEVDLFNVTAGTILRVNPHVFRDQDQTRIRMLVDIEDGSILPNTDVDDIPIIERSSVSTQAMVVNGESLLLGGMTVDATADDVTQVPILGDIPLLGELFKFRTKQRAHTERLFLITPRLATLTSRLAAARAVVEAATVTQPIAAMPAPGAVKAGSVAVTPATGGTPR